MNLQVTASFTAEPIERPLRFLLSELGVECGVGFSPYNQVVQQVLDPASAVRSANAGHFFLVRARDLAPSDPRAGLTAFVDALREQSEALGGRVQVIFCPQPRMMRKMRCGRRRRLVRFEPWATRWSEVMLCSRCWSLALVTIGKQIVRDGFPSPRCSSRCCRSACFDSGRPGRCPPGNSLFWTLTTPFGAG